MTIHDPWLWFAAGVIMAALEMILPGFYLLGVAVGLVATGFLTWMGLTGTLPVMLIAAGLISVLAWAGLRRFAGVRRGQRRLVPHDINDNQPYRKK